MRAGPRPYPSALCPRPRWQSRRYGQIRRRLEAPSLPDTREQREPGDPRATYATQTRRRQQGATNPNDAQ
jgi:hypothetical protein